jgi:hypothetical protein
MAATYPKGNSTPTFIYSDQANDSVVVKSGSQTLQVPARRNTGLLAPGAPLLYDLNGDGIMDLIVPNPGGNDVLVYPGRADGTFGPAMNDGNGFPTGTNPVAVIVANLNGRPDLLVADKGSNDVSVLLNNQVGNSFTFIPGPRISVGQGPVALLYGDFYGNGAHELAVSDSGSNDVMLLPSLGNGFFSETDRTVVALQDSPGMIVGGPFSGGSGIDIVALNPGTGNVTLIANLSNGNPTSEVFSSGGFDPVAAVDLSNEPADLVVANNADGRVALLVGGPQGLTVEQVYSSPDLPNPTGLAAVLSPNNMLEVYASSAGNEAATLLGFSLGGLGGVSSTTGGQALTLLALQNTPLPLIATLFTPSLNLNATEEGPSGSGEGNTATSASSTATTNSLGQGPFTSTVDNGDSGDDLEVLVGPDTVTPAVSEKARLSPWRRIEIGVDEAFDEFRRANQPKAPSTNEPDEEEENAPPDAAASTGSAHAISQVQRLVCPEILDAALHSLVEGGRIATAMPAARCEDPARMREVRRASSPLTSAALLILHGALARAPARPLRCFQMSDGYSAPRTQSVRKFVRP